jgi:hypothetical protein
MRQKSRVWIVRTRKVGTPAHLPRRQRSIILVRTLPRSIAWHAQADAMVPSRSHGTPKCMPWHAQAHAMVPSPSACHGTPKRMPWYQADAMVARSNRAASRARTGLLGEECRRVLHERCHLLRERRRLGRGLREGHVAVRVHAHGAAGLGDERAKLLARRVAHLAAVVVLGATDDEARRGARALVQLLVLLVPAWRGSHGPRCG